jgi:hypothetical protein
MQRLLLVAALCALLPFALVSAQNDLPALEEALELSSALDAIVEALMKVSVSGDLLGNLNKETIEANEVQIADEVSEGVSNFLTSVTSMLERQRDLVEATYLSPSSHEACELPNSLDPSYFEDFVDGIDRGNCLVKSPSSEATLSQDFVNWAPTLMEDPEEGFVLGNNSLVAQYFGDAETGNFVYYP